jgi:hypothetical protein
MSARLRGPLPNASVKFYCSSGGLMGLHFSLWCTYNYSVICMILLSNLQDTTLATSTNSKYLPGRFKFLCLTLCLI